MATVVPFSHCQRWRSRSRTASMDAMILGELPPSPPPPPSSSSGTYEDDSSSSEAEDDDWVVDSPQSATGLVMPRGFASTENRQPAPVPLGTLYNNVRSPVRDSKAMERRRATGSRV